MTEVLRRGRASLAFGFFAQGAAFALLVTRIPAIQDRYGISDGLLPVFLAAVPVLAGAGSVNTERLVRRVRPSRVLRWSQPLVLLALIGVAAGHQVWQVGLALALFGLAVGALDASMNMLGVSLQHAYGRSIMLGFHAAFSLGGILGASVAWAGAHWKLSLLVTCLPVVLILLPATLIGSRWYVDGERNNPPTQTEPTQTEQAQTEQTQSEPVWTEAPQPEEAPRPADSIAFKLLLPLCLVMAFAYIGDSTVSNWSAKYLRDVLGSSEQLSTVPYNVYMAMTLLGRGLGDLGVRRFGAVGVVRCGTVVAVLGFAVVATAPGAGTGILGFTLLGLGLCVLVPQTFAAAGRRAAQRHGPAASDSAIARLNVFNYVGFLVGSPLVGALGDAWNYRAAMLVPMVLVAVTLCYAKSFAPEPDRYGGGHERPRTADVG